jgi:RluA family pseudouridine synthase
MSNDLGFQILYEQNGCLVVNKPPGVLTQAVPGVDSLEVRVKAYLAGERGGGEVYLNVIHRLDRPASGAIIFGKDLRTTRKLGAQFENRRVQKVYWACVGGAVTSDTGRWEDHLYKVEGQPRAEVVTAEHPKGRHAALRYRVLRSFNWGTLLEIELETGRTHQIRVQAASRGHPVLGDKQYGSSIHFGPQFDDQRLQAIALHARSLTFRNPDTHETVVVEAPVAAYWPTEEAAM